MGHLNPYIWGSDSARGVVAWSKALAKGDEKTAARLQKEAEKRFNDKHDKKDRKK